MQEGAREEINLEGQRMKQKWKEAKIQIKSKN